uniref:Uncharacterized protein n=1 Tax=Poecilia mexicana TaxID=48701 RepID=A0A3B3YKH3_9TELE
MLFISRQEEKESVYISHTLCERVGREVGGEEPNLKYNFVCDFFTATQAHVARAYRGAEGCDWRAGCGCVERSVKLEQINDDDRIFYITESKPFINTVISGLKENNGLKCAIFTGVHCHKGATLMMFDEAVIRNSMRDRPSSGR